MKRYLFTTLGMITLGLGLLGIVTPGLPTTPFILATAALFAKSSPRLYQKLLKNKLTGSYLNRVSNGLGTKGLIVSISLMWCMILFTTFCVFEDTMSYIMIGLGSIGTIAQIIVLRKRKKKESANLLKNQQILMESGNSDTTGNFKKNV